MPKFTDEQVERAKNVDVRTFLEQTEGYTFEGNGRFLKCANTQRTKQPSSLSIDTQMNRIFYNSVTGNRPLSAVDWCTKIKNMDFQSSMRLILGENPQSERVERPKYQQHTPQPKTVENEPKNLELSEKSDISKNVYAYLTKTRCIPHNIVNDCLNQNLIYQDVRKNAVFVGYDSDNKIPKYAARRGTFTPDGKEPFKRDCVGSDKNFAFRLEGKNTDTVYVAEAAIDVLSLAALEDKFHGSGAYKEKTYLSTGGAGIDNALEQFCKTHDVKTINVCFDDDEAGKNGMEKIMQKFRERGYTVNDMRAKMAHDYNDELVAWNNNPDFYSKPPDFVKKDYENIKKRIDIMPKQNYDDKNLQATDISPENIAYNNYPPDDYPIPNEPYNEQLYQPMPEPAAEMVSNIPPENDPYYNYPSEDIPFDDYPLPNEPHYEPPLKTEQQRQQKESLTVSQPKNDEIEKTALFSIQQNGELYYYSTEKTANEILHISANSENPFIEMMKQGERISEADYAEIMQSDKIKFAVDMNFDSKTANIFAVNNGRGGIAESDRNESNTSFKKANLSLFAKKEINRNNPEPHENSFEERIAEPEARPVAHTQPKMQAEKDISDMDNPEKTNLLLAALKERQENRRADLLDRADTVDNKILDRKERIDSLNKKISDIETSIKTAAAFKRVFGNNAIGSLIDRSIEKKQEKIKKIREVKIPKQEAKIDKLNVKKTRVTNKLAKTNRKIQNINKVQNFISAVSSKDKQTRHQGFVAGLRELSDIRCESLENKLSKVQSKIDMLSVNMSSPDLSNMDRLQLKRDITSLKRKSLEISDKIGSIVKLRNDLEDMKNGKYSEKDIETAVSKTAENMSAKLEGNDMPENNGIVSNIISHTVESGREAVSEVTAQKSAERAEKAKPDLDRERVPEERKPDVTVSTEQQILISVAEMTGVDISELNRFPVEIKADIIADYIENNGNISNQKKNDIIEWSWRNEPNEKTVEIQKILDEKEKEKRIADIQSIDEKKQTKNHTKILFSRSSIMSDKYKPTSSKSAEDIERDRQNRNRGNAL